MNNQTTFDLGDTPRVEFAMAVSERPQSRVENFGVGALSDTELLAMALQGNGILYPGRGQVEEIAFVTSARQGALA